MEKTKIDNFEDFPKKSSLELHSDYNWGGKYATALTSEWERDFGNFVCKK